MKKKKSLSRREVLKMIALTGAAQTVAPFVGATQALAGNPISKEIQDLWDRRQKVDCDVVIIGAGVMGGTLAVLLKELSPGIKIEIYERLGDVALESSAAMNNAGTGHSALCELNYSPQAEDGSVDITKAIKVLEAFEISKQFWSYLVSQGHYSTPTSFINSVPHMSLVWGDDNISYLKKRYETMKTSHLFKGMVYSEDAAQMAEWMPLIANGSTSRKMACSRSELGTDVNFGEVTRGMFKHLDAQSGVNLHLNHEVQNLHQDSKRNWHLTIKDKDEGTHRRIKTKFVFIGAGGGALPLLEKSGVIEGRGYGGFPVGGQFLVCENQELIEKHHAKVYGKAAIGSPPMSVPHLDSRVIDGKRVLLFGPYAGFSTRFLKKGSNFDLPLSVDIHNIKTMLGAGAHNIPLTQYLIGQVMQSPEDRMNALRDFVPDARMEDWKLVTAGQRVQVIKKDRRQWGVLEFGTEVVTTKDGTLGALLGASPGASSSVSAMLDILGRCFPNEMKSSGWSEKLRQMIPTFGKHLAEDASLTRKTRAKSHAGLGLLAAQ